MKRLSAVLSVAFYPIVVLKNYPILIKWREFYIVTGGVINSIAAVISILIAFYYYRTLFPAETAGPGFIWKLTMVGFFSLLFSKLFHFAAMGREFLRNPGKYMSETAFYNQGGQIGVLFGTIWLAWSSGINFLACMDINLLAGCFGLAMGRLGCYSYGCCHGRETTSRFATVYTHPSTKALRVFPELTNVPLVPTQLISAAFTFALFVVLVGLMTRAPEAGMVSAAFIVTYNCFRFFIERYRLSVVNVESGKVRMRFYMSVAATILGIGVIYAVFVLSQQSPRLTIEQPLSLGQFLAADVAQPQTIGAMAVVLAVYILMWSTHYKKLGQHFEWKKV